MANLCPFRKLLLNKLSLKKPFSAGNLMDTLNDLFALWREDYDLGVLMARRWRDDRPPFRYFCRTD